MKAMPTIPGKAGASMALERELDTFGKQLLGLLQDPKNHGKFALVYGDAVYGLFDSVDDALAAGYERFSLEPFLVKHVVEHEEPRYFSRNVKRCR
jgi:hypothetical protein